jgi:Bacterial aa3 type cytochrome c oxidase subunit IV
VVSLAPLPLRDNCGKSRPLGKPHKIELEDGMADHGTVEYATATGNDLPAHEATYESFVHLAMIGTFVVINIVIGLAIGAVAEHWGVAACVILLAVAIGLRGLVSGAVKPIAVMTVLSLLALAITA